MPKFKAGESVVCINDDFDWSRKKYHGLSYPTRGTCYVVRRYVCGGEHPAIVLVGLRNIRVRYTDGVVREAGFWDERFEKAPGIDDIRRIAADVGKWCGVPENETPMMPINEMEDA